MLLFGRLVGSDTDYDEGVYLSSVDALEHGQRLGADVFAPQPPVFYLLLRVISLAGADSVRGFQIGMVVLAVLTCLAAYLLGRAIAGPVAGLTAAALLTVAPPFPLFAHRVLADLPPLGISLLAFWLAWEAKERRSLGLAAAGGAALALAVAVKPNAVLAVVPFLLLLLWERSGRGRMLVAALGGAGVVGAVLVVAYRDVLGELWESVVVYHRDARDTPDVIDKWHELATFLNWRTPFAWLVVAGLAASVVLVRRWQTGPVWALWAWAAISLAFLAYHHPLHYNHLLDAAGRARRAGRDRARRARGTAAVAEPGAGRRWRCCSSRATCSNSVESSSTTCPRSRSSSRSRGSWSARPIRTTSSSRTTRSSPSSPTAASPARSSTRRCCASRPAR